MFNVLNEPWIRAVTPGGKQAATGLKGILVNAHEYADMCFTRADHQFTMYRFLSCVASDIFQPESVTDLAELLEEGKFPEEEVQAYFRRCEEEGVTFDLFDPARPFMQAPPDPDVEDGLYGLRKIDMAMPTGTNSCHLLQAGQYERPYPAGDALVNLMTQYVFATSGGVGYPSGPQGGSVPKYFLPFGETLFETVVMNMVCKGDYPGKYDQDQSGYSPILYRSSRPIKPVKINGRKADLPTVSIFRAMIFPARRIRLVEGENGMASGVWYSPGESVVKGLIEDPSCMYIKGKVKRAEKPGESLWSDMYATLCTDDNKAMPVVLKNAVELSKSQNRLFVMVKVFDVPNKQALIENSAVNTSRIQIAWMEKPELVKAIHDYLNDMNAVCEKLRKTVSGLCKECDKNKAVVDEALAAFRKKAPHHFHSIFDNAAEEEKVFTADDQIEWSNQLFDFALAALDSLEYRFRTILELGSLQKRKWNILGEKAKKEKKLKNDQKKAEKEANNRKKAEREANNRKKAEREAEEAEKSLPATGEPEGAEAPPLPDPDEFIDLIDEFSLLGKLQLFQGPEPQGPESRGPEFQKAEKNVS